MKWTLGTEMEYKKKWHQQQQRQSIVDWNGENEMGEGTAKERKTPGNPFTIRMVPCICIHRAKKGKQEKGKTNPIAISCRCNRHRVCVFYTTRCCPVHRAHRTPNDAKRNINRVDSGRKKRAARMRNRSGNFFNNFTLHARSQLCCNKINLWNASGHVPATNRYHHISTKLFLWENGFVPFPFVPLIRSLSHLLFSLCGLLCRAFPNIVIIDFMMWLNTIDLIDVCHCAFGTNVHQRVRESIESIIINGWQSELKRKFDLILMRRAFIFQMPQIKTH